MELQNLLDLETNRARNLQELVANLPLYSAPAILEVAVRYTL